MMRGVMVCAVAAGLRVSGPAAAQEFVPPDQRGRQTSTAQGSGLALGIFGFSTRGGGQVNQDAQGVVGSTIDVVQLGSPQVRLRPSFETGFGRRHTSLHLALEIVYRFQPDDAAAIPYLGAGIGYYDNGSSDRVWPNLVLGFELPLERTFNWLIEYHALDRLGRHRFLVGLATRGGGR